jgi:hypothetical protein
MKTFLFSILAFTLLATPAAAEPTESVERWGVFELTLEGPRKGNPFVDVDLSAEFARGDETVRVTGFYDGEGVYRVRFMPNRLGEWTYRTESNAPELDAQEGRLTCTPAGVGNHGPVKVRGTFHFAYADGTPYRQMGTTSYAWIHQAPELQEQTLKTLAASPFNKIRMCVFPKDYVYNQNEPELYPFVRDEADENDYTRFDPAFWHHLETRILDLQELGIEADIILFHPYDRWGYSQMDDDTDDFYLRYALARLSAHRNVWWSLANEFDFMLEKQPSDWDRIFEVIYHHDPYGRLRGIHNGRVWYDHTKPWVTHASIQSSDFSRIGELREKYRKPVVFDECRYEGNIKEGWGNITAKEMVDRFWRGTVAGAYVGHGETYQHPEDILWWSKGGVFHGESPARIAFLMRFLDESPEEGIEPLGPGVGGREGEYYLHYFGEETPETLTLDLPPYREFEVTVIDTWNMKAEKQSDTVLETATIELPGRPFMAVQVRRVDFDFPAEPVTIDSNGVQFLEEKVVRLRHKSHPRIHYTLDGTAPTAESTLYGGPITITEAGVTLRAYSVGEDGKASPRVSREFHKTTPRPAVSAGKTAPGLRFRLYHGAWSRLPDFDAEPVVKQGVSPVIDLSLGDREDDFGLVFEGLLDVPEDAVHTFTATSDDGSRLTIGGTLVIDNDGEHAPEPKTGQIGLAKGLHEIRVEFFERMGGQALEMEWSSPALAPQPIPAERLSHRTE